jgi:hypothetical protein
MKTLSHLMIFLALGAVMSLSGISSCKKPAPPDPGYERIFGLGSMPMDPKQNFSVSGAPSNAPIPGTLLLFGSGVAGMAWFGWRKRTKR